MRQLNTLGLRFADLGEPVGSQPLLCCGIIHMRRDEYMNVKEIASFQDFDPEVEVFCYAVDEALRAPGIYFG